MATTGPSSDPTEKASPHTADSATADNPPRVNEMLDPDGVPAAPITASNEQEKEKNLVAEKQIGQAETKKSKKLEWPAALKWIPANLSWPHARDVFRCTLTGWVSILFLIIGPVQRLMGVVSLDCLRHILVNLMRAQASFLILVSAFLSPPAEPFIVVLEREMLILLFAALAWAYVKFTPITPISLTLG
jgi:hypothetical protein